MPRLLAAGTRDDGKHDGMRPQGFLSSVNAFIRARRRAGHGIFLPEAHAMHCSWPVPSW